jgi:uncharacterized protein involved in exopolysaccharide biosynthesis
MKDDTGFDLQLYWQVLRRRLPLLLIPLVVLTSILGLGSFLMPNIYRTSAQVVVRAETDPVKGLAVETQMTQQLGGVLQSLGQPGAQKELFETLKTELPPGTRLEDVLTDFQTNLTITRREEGKDLLVEFAYEGTPEKYAIAVVNAFAEEFRRRGTRLVAESLVVSLEFVDDQIGTYRKRLEALDERERNVQQRLTAELGDLVPATAPEGVGKQAGDRLTATDAELEKLTLEISSLEAQVSFLRSQLARTPATLEVRAAERGDTTEAELERLLAEAQAKLTGAQMQYTTKHPQVLMLQEQVADLTKRLREARSRRGAERSDVANPAHDSLQRELMMAESQLELQRSQRTTMATRRDKLRQITAAAPQFEEELGRITEERAALKTVYESLLQRKQSLELNQSFETDRNTGRFDIARAGGVPLRPIRPNRAKYLMMGLMAGLFLGISFMLLAEYLDHAIRSEEALGRYIDAPLLAVLPRDPR